MNVQWYPGHMTKAKRQMQEDIKLIDLIIELVDSRVPLASRMREFRSAAGIRILMSLGKIKQG